MIQLDNYLFQLPIQALSLVSGYTENSQSGSPGTLYLSYHTVQKQSEFTTCS